MQACVCRNAQPIRDRNAQEYAANPQTFLNSMPACCVLPVVRHRAQGRGRRPAIDAQHSGARINARA
ncbi:hypothetical protein SBA5_250039 [Candidatus Sulfotelmatomonas gaucii]|uniref:Uncharacterized protein n=1 Tax=Candidatus Sulfuritelmatomonas gaucii TaxID=2043161 RepID=A0A2N9L947_9BACT|nr:hypothetical protein SBA5_250039 [Candidatus Sulfotelmatomonas gaucii]